MNNITSEQWELTLKSIKHIAIKYGHKLPNDWVEELNSVGVLAALEALPRYTNKASLKSFLTTRARGAMIDYLRLYGPARLVRPNRGPGVLVQFVHITTDRRDRSGIFVNDPRIKRLL